MKEFELSIDILNRILDEKIPFSAALKDTFYSNVALRPMRPLVSSWVGCEIRHHLLLSYLTNGLEGLEENEKRAVCLALADLLYLKRVEKDACLKALNEFLNDGDKLAKAIVLIEEIVSKDDPIPESIDHSSNEYLSLRYNAPIWVVKVIQHFGYGNCFKTLRCLSRQEKPTYRVCTSRISLEEVLKNPDFSKTNVDGILSYNGTTPIRKMQWHKDGAIFQEKGIVKTIIEEHKIHEPGEVFLYNGRLDSSFERELIESYGSSIGLNIAAKSIDQKPEVLKAIKDAGLHNVNFFSAADTGAMESSISKKQDLVICCPASTDFELIRSTPDYLLHFDRDGMDALIENERKALDDCSFYVEEDGTLIYVIFTVSRKEGRATVSNFLKTHENFKLISHKQYFPFEKEGVCAYVAVLKNSPNLAKATPPITDLSAFAKETQISISASSEK